jgi:manganese transport system permease protein
MSPLDLVTEPLQYDFMLRALAATSLAAVACALLSCWLVLIGWSLMGDAVSHAVLPGVVLSYALGLPFALGAIVFGLLAVVLIGTVRESRRLAEDAAIGIVFTTLFALGLVLVSVTPSHTDLGHILFGSVLGVSRGALAQIAVLAGVALAVLLLRRRDLTLYAFDPTHARAIGLSPRRLGALLLGLLAVTAVVALQVVGVILVVAMLIIPGATARLLTDRFSRMLLIAPTLSVAASAAGILLSYWLDASSGGLIVLVQGALFTLVHLFAPRYGLFARHRARRGEGPAGRASSGAASSAHGSAPTEPQAPPSVSEAQIASVAERPSGTAPSAPTSETSSASENSGPSRISSSAPTTMP